MTFKYRRDGWPLCPQCGDDELMSTERIFVFGRKAGQIRQPTPADSMKCLRCGWDGTVPVRELATR